MMFTESIERSEYTNALSLEEEVLKQEMQGITHQPELK